MKWRAIDMFIDPPRYYEIDYDPAIGYYLYVFENDKCMYDDLQFTLEAAMRRARKDFDVSLDAWIKIEE